MSRGRHARRHVGAIAVAVVAAFLLLSIGGVSFAAYRYDQATADRILPGVTIAGVDVGGLTRSQAIAAVQAKADQRLSAALTISAAGRTWTVTPKELGQAANVDTAVDEALQASASLSMFSRVWHRVRHESVGVSLDLTYGSGGSAVGSLVSAIAKQVTKSPVNADVSIENGKVVFRKAKDGRELGVKVAEKRVLAALDSGSLSVSLPVRPVRPDITNAKIGKTIVVNREINELYLYDGFHLERHFPVATAAPGYVTPAGSWQIVNKVENPTWYNPAPTTWGAGEPLVIPPGPGNPLGTRALYLNAPGIRIHGTYDSGSVGTHASHGCIRMYISDSETLYPLVPIGTRVLIY